MKYYIYAPGYNENSGGSVVLHRLCHLINSIEGCEAYLVPPVPEQLTVTNFRLFIRNLACICKWLLSGRIFHWNYKTNPHWMTPVISKFFIKDINSSIVIYPEITHGNPLNGRNVVRWFLHQPGYFTKQINFGVNELHYKFNSAIRDFNHCLSSLSMLELKVIYYPLEHYNMNGSKNVTGCCHSIRKGKNKNQCHPSDSILIDGLSHHEVSEIFKKSKRFISYDDYTAYSLFASLCGCESIVVPGDGVSKEEWYPNPTDRYGIAYGFSEQEIAGAKATKDKVLAHILKEHENSYENVKNFIKETQLNFF